MLMYAYDRESAIFYILAFVTIMITVGAAVGKCYSEIDQKARARQLCARVKDLGFPNFPISQDVPIFYNGIAQVSGSPIDPEFEIVTMD